MTERLQTALFHRNPVGAVALTLVGLGLGVWAVVNSPVFGIDRIRVEGAHELTADEVRSLADVDAGTNLVRLPVGDVAARLERSPWVRDALVERSLPATLLLRIEERRPVGWIEGPSGPALVADDGTVLDGPGPGRLPVLGAVADPAGPGERLEGVATLRVAASMTDALLASVSSVAEERGQVVLELRDGGQVRYGEPERLGAKNRALLGMLAWAEERSLGIGYIDVRVPSAPALAAG